MKNRIWSKNLYFEGLRRLRTLIITFAALSAAVTALCIVVNIINHNRFDTWRAAYAYSLPCLLFVFSGAPALAFRTFSFLNKRRGSDFFHALPYTRSCLFFSFLTSLFTGIFAVNALVAAAGIIAYAASGAAAVVYPTFFLLVLGCFIASLFVASIVVMTASASGSAFTETVMSIVLLIFPQVLIRLFYSSIISNVNTATATDLYYVTNSWVERGTDFSSLPLRLLLSFLSGYGEDSVRAPLPYIYTSVACLLYFAAAYLFFRFRKSEGAEKSAPSRAVQAVFRVVVTCAFSFVGIYALASCFDGNGNIKDDLPLAIVFFTLAVIAYFIFELISSKGKRNLLKTLPTFAVVVALNFAFFGALYGAYRYEMQFGTKPEKVSSVTAYVENVGTSKGENMDLDTLACRRILAKGFKIKGEETIEDMCREIDAANKEWRTGDGWFTYFNIRCGIITKTRSLGTYTDLETLIKDEIRESEKYKKEIKNLPEQSDKEVKVYYATCISVKTDDGERCSYSLDDVDRVIDALQKELQGVDTDGWYKLISKTGVKGGDAYIRYRTDYGYLTVPLSETLTPKSYQMAYEAGIPTKIAGGIKN